MSALNTERDMRSLGITHIVGSVVKRTADFQEIIAQNDAALRLRDLYQGFYIPGVHIHPSFVRESIAELKRLHREGVRVIGELVPYIHSWGVDYDSPALSEILNYADECGMVISFHGSTEHREASVAATDRMVEEHPNLIFIGAHVCTDAVLESHISRLKRYPNYMVDLSGGGIYRHGVLRHLIDECGDGRILFGSDYPVCNPAAYVGGVMLDFLISEEEKRAVMFENADRLLKKIGAL